MGTTVEHESSPERRPRSSHGRLVGGIILIAVGFVFLLEELFVFDIAPLWDFWPLILIGIGILKLIRGKGPAWGVFWIFLGTWLLLDEIDLVYAEDSWPVLLMAGGGLLIYSALRRRRTVPPPVE